jgi:lipoyl(octanoyl) transferase
MPHPTPQARWRLLVSVPADGADNMALDEALMEHARRSGEWVLRVYGWARPTLSFGRNQTARGAYDDDAIRRRDLDVVRRPTGGRAILHDREVTYSVAAPADDAGPLGASYARINRLLVDGLRRLGVDAAVADRRGAHLPPGTTPCFAEPAAGELVLGDRKLAGSAQWREDGALLQHGSILVDGDQALVATLLREPAPAPPPAATLREALGRAPALAEVADALAAAVREIEDPHAFPLEPGPDLIGAARRLRERYRDPTWTWRR